MNKIEKLVRQFLLESRFRDQTLMSLYESFQSRFDNVSQVTFEDFKDAYLLFDFVLVTDSCEICSNERKISSNEEIHPIFLTNAYLTLSDLYRRQTSDEIAAILDESTIDYYYDDLDLSLTEAYELKKDYTIYRVDISQTRDIRTIEYSVTAEELAKQVKEAIKEIESCGKVVTMWTD